MYDSLYDFCVVNTMVGPVEKKINLHLLPVKRNYLQVNPTCYLLAE